jgi:CRISPR/Cas system-associated exonuclease Cas4 (RecB family)
LSNTDRAHAFNWSFSSLMIYEACPLRFKLAKIDRLPELPRPPDNPMERGNRIHGRLEKYVKGESNEMDEEAKAIRTFVPLIEHARVLYAEGKATAEQDWLFNRDWDDCNRNDVWLWAKLDLNVQDMQNGLVVPIDYKSGKSQFKQIEHVQQLQLYSGLAALRYEWAETITSELWYVDEGHIKSYTVNREEALKYIGRFEKRADRIYEDKHFRANPNMITCAYCPYGPRRGTGACPVGV